MKPNFRLYATAENMNHWRDDVVQRCGGGISGVYLYNANRQVHCCEITPSYEMTLMAYIPHVISEDDVERDGVEELLREALGESDSVSYFHCRSVDKRDLPVLPYVDQPNCLVDLPFTDDEWLEILDENDGDENAAYEAACDSIIEYLNANGYY